MDVKKANSFIMEAAAALLNAEQPLFSAEEVRAFSRDCRMPLSEGYTYLVAPLLGLKADAVGEHKELLHRYLIPMLHESDPTPYLTDPYLEAVPFREKKLGAWELGQKRIAAMELFPEGEPVRKADGRLIPQLGFFTGPYGCPAVYENGREWMTLLPNEIVTQQAAIEAAHGRVLTYGLGLGYYACRAAMKREVTSVTVAELSKDVIRLFTAELLPGFAERDKLRFIETDALSYAASLTPGQYDFVFADIWHDAGDGMPLYLALKEQEQRAPGTRFAYWIEESMRQYLDADLWPKT